MAYHHFTLDSVAQAFALTLEEASDLFGAVASLTVDAAFLATLKHNVPLAQAIHTEKARSEFIIAPVLSEFHRQMQRRISLFSGVELNVDADQGLVGVCDFIISHSAKQIVLDAPLIMIVEAKNENIKSSLGQCIAEMVAARIVNERERIPIEAVYGIVTSGTDWRFLRLQYQAVLIDFREYHILEVDKIMAILMHIARSTEAFSADS